MLKTQSKRLAGLERRLADRVERQRERWYEAIWAQFSDAEGDAIIACLERAMQPGYQFTAEDAALERRWDEAVQAVAPESEQRALQWALWAVNWRKAVTGQDSGASARV